MFIKNYNGRIRLKCSLAKCFRLLVPAIGIIFLAAPVQAASLRDALTDLVSNHKRMLAATADLEAAKENIRVARGDWYPNLGVTANIGNEWQEKPTGSDDTNMVPRNVETKVTQKLWDFGSTNSAIRRANLVYRQVSATRDTALQSVMLDGLLAHLNLVRQFKLLDFAKSSAENIKRQAELEDAKVQRGSGLSTDVLQAKTQLAGAQARVIRTEGDLKNALNRYRAIFGKEPEKLNKLNFPRLPLEVLPESLDELIYIVEENNPSLRAERIGASIAREDLTKTRADEFMPKFDVIGEHKAKEDSGGTVGSQQDWLIKLEASYSLNLGLTAVNTLRASQQNQIATVNRFGDQRDLIEEQARNAWNQLQTTQKNAQSTHNQADIASEFLELARRERELGNRSLIDVLAGETALINASSDATSADTDVAIAIFTMLSVMGQLDPKSTD